MFHVKIFGTDTSKKSGRTQAGKLAISQDTVVGVLDDLKVTLGKLPKEKLAKISRIQIDLDSGETTEPKINL